MDTEICHFIILKSCHYLILISHISFQKIQAAIILNFWFICLPKIVRHEINVADMNNVVPTTLYQPIHVAFYWAVHLLFVHNLFRGRNINGR